MELIEMSLTEGLSQLKGYVSCTSYVFHDAEKWAIPCPWSALSMNKTFLLRGKGKAENHIWENIYVDKGEMSGKCT